MTAQELQTLFEKEIPISLPLGVKVLSVSPEKMELSLPLSKNRNHKGTMFGGSLYAGCAFACYGIFLASLRGEGISTNDIVISEGTMKYLAPVTGDCQIQGGFESVSAKEGFFKTLKSKNKARLTMKAKILVGETICAEFTGQFVAKT